MNARIRGLLLIYCVGCYVAFGLFFALTPLWWHDMWNQLGGRVVIIYGLMAPVSIPMLAVAPVALPPGPGIHAVIFWVVCVISFAGTYRWMPRRPGVWHRKGD